jgi:hypothetical protein
MRLDVNHKKTILLEILWYICSIKLLNTFFNIKNQDEIRY